MIWGFLKYYHPAIAAGDYNWDASLFRILPNIIAAKTKGEASASLEEWTDEIGKPDPCSNCDSPKTDTCVQLMPDYGNLFSKGNLGDALIEKLKYIRDNRNQDENYYVSMADDVGNPVFEHERPYKNMIYPDA